MNTASFIVQTSTNDKGISGDGDGYKQITPIRHPIPSSRKFTPTSRKTKDMKSKLESALQEMKTPNKTLGLRTKLRVECSSVDSPVGIPNRKRAKYVEKHDEVKIYCSPRGSAGIEKFPTDSARLVFKYLLLNSWRKCKSRYNDASNLLSLKESKINQLNMQIEVFRNLRKSESSRREEIHLKYNEIQKEFDVLIQQNVVLRNHIECLERDKNCIISELERLNERTKYYKEEIEDKTNLLNAQIEKFDKEKDKLKKLTIENKQTQEKNYKLKNIVNVQKENLEKLKSCVESLQKSKLDLNFKFERTQESCRNYSEQLRILTLENAVNKSKISSYETEKEELRKEIKNLQAQLETVGTNCDNLRKVNESIQLEMVDLSKKYQEEKKMVWIWMRTGLTSTYGVLRYLAEKIIPALQANLAC